MGWTNLADFNANYAIHKETFSAPPIQYDIKGATKKLFSLRAFFQPVFTSLTSKTAISLLNDIDQAKIKILP